MKNFTLNGQKPLKNKNEMDKCRKYENQRCSNAMILACLEFTTFVKDQSAVVFPFSEFFLLLFRQCNN